MNTSFPSVTLRADKTAAVNAARRASITKADAEEESRFQDLLSEHKTHEASADGTVSGDQSRLAALRHVAAERMAASGPADRANPPTQPIQTASVQQAMLAPPVEAELDTSETVIGLPDNPVSADATVDQKVDGAASETSSGTVTPPILPHDPPALGVDTDPTPTNTGKKLPLIAPHSPPVVGDDDSTLAGDITSAQLDPHDPPALGVDIDPTPTGSGKLPFIAPHGPVAATGGDTADTPTATSAQDKPGVIRPHGPVQPAPPIRIDEQMAAAAKTDATLRADPAPTPSLELAGVSSDVRTATIDSPFIPVAMPTTQMNPDVPTTPAGGLAKNEYTTAIPIRQDTPMETPLAKSSLPATAFLVTNATQAQLAASQAVDAPGTPALFSTAQAANLAAHVGQTLTGVSARTVGGLTQHPDLERVSIDGSISGTAAAKRQGNVLASPSNPATATESAAWNTVAADVFGAPDFTQGQDSDTPSGRAKDGDAARASAATVSTANPSAAAPQTSFPTAASAAPSAGIVQVDKMEALLQAVQQTAAQAQFDGTGQVELRVRLAGVADDVTVRVHLDANKQAQVSFQTGSPELRAALEQGWNDLTASTAGTAAFSPASMPDFPSAQPATTPAPSGLYRDDRRAPTATISEASEQSARRWSGYA